MCHAGHWKGLCERISNKGRSAFQSNLYWNSCQKVLLSRTQNFKRKLHALNRYLYEVSPLSNLCLPKPFEWNSWTHLLERCPSSGAWQIKWHLLERHFLSLSLSASLSARARTTLTWVADIYLLDGRETTSKLPIWALTSNKSKHSGVILYSPAVCSS